MKFHWIILLLVSLKALISCQVKPDPREIRLQHLLDSIYQEHPNGVGFILHVEAPDQNISWGGAVGYSNRDTQQPLSKDQPGQIASITKTFTAVAIFRLIEQGKITLHQPIKNLLPERTAILLEDNGYNLDSITIAHLLSHRSGISSSGTQKSKEILARNLQYRWSRDEQIRDVIKMNQKGTVGAFQYSDVNYSLLTEIMEEVTKKAFYLAIRELLKYDELGLNNTWFYSLERDPMGSKERFYQYKESRNWVSTYDESPTWGLYGASGVVSTAKDVAVFAYALGSGKIFDKLETLDLMFTPIGKEKQAEGIGMLANEDQYASQYRMGITQIDGPGFKAFGHDGYWGSLMYYFPEHNASFAFFGLNADEMLDFDKLFMDISEILE